MASTDNKITGIVELGKAKRKSFVVTFFDKRGVETQDQSLACASSCISDNNRSFKLRINRRGRLYNPTSNLSLSTIDKVTGSMHFKWREVPEKAFRTYLVFLKKNHDSLLVQAERELK